MNKNLINKMCKALAVSMSITILLISNSILALAAPKEMQDGTIFDAEYYAQKYADVVAVYGTDEATLFQHYTEYGKAENREAVKTPSVETFDPVYYANQNPDVVAVYGNGNNNLYQHYIQYGVNEGRKPTANAAAVTSKPVSKVPENTSQNAPMTKEEAMSIWNNWWNSFEVLSYFESVNPAVLAHFDKNGDMTINQEESDMLMNWILYANDSDKGNNTTTQPLDDSEIIAMVTRLKEGNLLVPDTIRDIYYADGLWILN